MAAPDRQPPSGSPGRPGSAVPGAAVGATALFVLAAAAWTSLNIEDDLTARARAALATAGIPVTVRYEGLDAVLSGSATDARQAANAIGTVSAVAGTRHVTSRLDVMAAGAGGSGTLPTPTDPAGTGTGGTGGTGTGGTGSTGTTGGGTGTSPTGSPSATATPAAQVPGFPPGSITFATNDSALAPGTTTYLDQVVGYLQAHHRPVLVVRGHSDNSGTDELNWALSKRRATAVVAYLTAHGIPDARLRAEAYAATSPVAPNNTADGRAANRRVELAIEETS